MSAARIALAATVAALAFPAAASAATLCVNSPGGTCDVSFTAVQLQDALNASAGDVDFDTVRIAGGTYTGTFSHTSGNPVEIVGAGSGTILTNPDDAALQTVLSVDEGGVPDTTVRNLTVDMAPGANSNGDVGLSLFGGSEAEGVTVDGTGTDNSRGVSLNGSTFDQGTVTMPTSSASGTRNFFVLGNSTITDTEMTGESGVSYSQENTALTVSRSEITATQIGIETSAGPVNVDNTLIDLGTSDSAKALIAENGNNNDDPMAINARHLTIVGGGPNSIAVRAIANSTAMTGNEDSTINFEDSVISGAATRIQALADNGDTATVNTSFSNYTPTGHDIDSDIDNAMPTGTAAVNETNRTNFAPGFLNPAAGNYRPVFGSALIDAGNPAGGGPALDLDNSTRVVDGDGTGPPRRDIGAYELDDLVGPSAQVTSGPSGATGDSTPTFDFASSEPNSTFVCRIDGGAFGACSGPGDSHTPGAALDDGTHKFEIRPTDPAGNVGTVGSRTFSVDGSAPVIQLSGPAGVITDPTPTFSFSSGESATFECRFDDAAFGPCSGPGNTHTPSPLADGLRTFEVRATDTLGNAAQSSAAVSIDATGPETTANTPKVKKDDATIKFSASEAGVSFVCKLDKGAFASCTSPKKYKNLDKGKHTVTIVASDALGNADPTPATKKFKIKD